MYYITCYKNSISKKSIPLYPKHLLKFQRQKTVEQYHEVLNYNPILLYPAVLTCVNEMATHIQVSLAPVLTWNSNSRGINSQLLGRQRQVISILWSTINTQEYASLLHSSFYLFKAVFRVVCVWEILSNCPLKHWFEELPKLNIKRVVHFTQLMHTNFVLRTAVTLHQLNGNAFLHLKCF